MTATLATLRAWTSTRRAAAAVTTLDVEHDAEEGECFARLVPDGAGGTASLFDVLDVEQGPTTGPWEIDAGFLRAPLPVGFTVRSVPSGSASPFDLVGPRGELIFAQRPAQLPAPDDMVGPGQRTLGRGPAWLEVEYDHDGRTWWQRHTLRGPVIVTAQAGREDADPTREALAAFLAGLVLA